jgi:hypothetical protein
MCPSALSSSGFKAFQPLLVVFFALKYRWLIWYWNGWLVSSIICSSQLYSDAPHILSGASRPPASPERDQARDGGQAFYKIAVRFYHGPIV